MTGYSKVIALRIPELATQCTEGKCHASIASHLRLYRAIDASPRLARACYHVVGPSDAAGSK